MATSTGQFVEMWQRLKGGQKIAIIASAVITLAIIGMLVFYGSQPDYGVLFTDLAPADANLIVDKLKAGKVPYQLSNNGSTISVPHDQIPELRLQMASTGGLSGGHVGFDIFDKNSFGVTDFIQQVNYQRALEGELARTLEGLKEVTAARVHITQPKESVFTEQKEPSKASIVLNLKGNELPQERVEAIVNLVASSVKGLEPENVSIMDTQGRLLASRHNEKGSNAMFNTLLDTRRKFEIDAASRIVALLEPIAGSGHVRADVTAELDLNESEQLEEKYDPKSAVIRSQQSAAEYKGQPKPDGTTSGVRANDPSAPVNAATDPQNATVDGDGRSANKTLYEIDKTVKKTTSNGGQIKRLSVSVLVDNIAANGKIDEYIKKIQDLTGAAVGFNATRGDQIVVQMIPFSKPETVVANPTWYERNQDLTRFGIKYGVLAFIALLLVFLVVRPAIRALKPAPASPVQLTPPAQASLFPLDNGDQLEATMSKTLADMELNKESDAIAEVAAEKELVPAREPLTEKDLPLPRESRALLLKEHLQKQTKPEGEKMAMTIRNWLQP